MSNRIRKHCQQLLVVAASVMTMGCAGIHGIPPMNYICGQNCPCANGANGVIEASTPVLQPPTPGQVMTAGGQTIVGSTAPGDVGIQAMVMENQAAILEQLDSIGRENQIIREQLGQIDSRSAEFQKKSEDMQRQLQQFNNEFAVIEEKLSQRRAELQTVADHVRTQNEQNVEILSQVEQQLDAALSAFDE